MRHNGLLNGGYAMKYSTEELLLATKIRELAVRLRHDKWIPESKTVLKNAEESCGPEPDRSGADWAQWNAKVADAEEAASDEWHKQHPLKSYIEQALELVQESAEIIAGKRA